MDKDLNAALDAVEISYKELITIANDMVSPITTSLDELVNNISNNSTILTIDRVRNYMLQLQLQAFSLSEIKEKSALKAELAQAIQKESFAISFNKYSGSAAVKDKLALLDNSKEIVTEALYELVADLLKTKVDQAHRLVAVLTSILMSKMQETKFMNIGVSAEVPPTTNKNTLEGVY